MTELRRSSRRSLAPTPYVPSAPPPRRRAPLADAAEAANRSAPRARAGRGSKRSAPSLFDAPPGADVTAWWRAPAARDDGDADSDEYDDASDDGDDDEPWSDDELDDLADAVAAVEPTARGFWGAVAAHLARTSEASARPLRGAPACQAQWFARAERPTRSARAKRARVADADADASAAGGAPGRAPGRFERLLAHEVSARRISHQTPA